MLEILNPCDNCQYKLNCETTTECCSYAEYTEKVKYHEAVVKRLWEPCTEHPYRIKVASEQYSKEHNGHTVWLFYIVKTVKTA